METYLYDNRVKAYLEQEDADVSLYASPDNTGYLGVTIPLPGGDRGDTAVREYRIVYEGETIPSGHTVGRQTVDGHEREVVLDRLYKGTQYRVCLTAVYADGTTRRTSVRFRTSDLGPRPLKIDGIANVRDLGGYRTETGSVTVQGRLFRGGSLSPTDDYPAVSLTPAGETVMREQLGIRYDMDLRTMKESGVRVSPVRGAEIGHFGIDGYDCAFAPDFRSRYRRVFRTLCCADHYPLYMHCTGGADRTGTVAFLFNALMGVPKADLIRDYEYTSFSLYGERNTKKGPYRPYFQPFLAAFERQTGDTYATKAESYMHTIGLTDTDIGCMRAIMGVL